MIILLCVIRRWHNDNILKWVRQLCGSLYLCLLLYSGLVGWACREINLHSFFFFRLWFYEKRRGFGQTCGHIVSGEKKGRLVTRLDDARYGWLNSSEIHPRVSTPLSATVYSQWSVHHPTLTHPATCLLPHSLTLPFPPPHLFIHTPLDSGVTRGFVCSF